MNRLRKSPFKVNHIEEDPNGFGLRTKEIIACAEALYNNRSILISGPRGIGKSSLGKQMQVILEGDDTLLRRCHIETRIPCSLCLFYAVDTSISLDQLALDILYNLERKCLLLSEIKNVEFKTSLEVNLGIIKASLEAKPTFAVRPPGTIATQLVDGLANSLDLLKRFTKYKGICIMIDEADLISADINFGHFIKIVHENIASKGLQVNFIIAGQQGIYSRFNHEDASFERIVKNISLSVLESDDAEYVLEYAGTLPEPTFTYAENSKELILSLSSGYPYILHLLGDAGYLCMEDITVMTQTDVLFGLENILRSDKKEKYLDYLKHLSVNERFVIIKMSEHKSKEIPVEIPYNKLNKSTSGFLQNQTLEEVIHSLVQKGFISVNSEHTYCRFREELFRVFVSLFRIELEESKRERMSQQGLSEKFEHMADGELLNLYESNGIDFGGFDSNTQRKIMRRINQLLENKTYIGDWEQNDGIDNLIGV